MHILVALLALLGSRSMTSAHHLGASIASARMAGRSTWLFIREKREHIQTQHGYLIWDCAHRSPPLSSKRFGSGTNTKCLSDAAQMCAYKGTCNTMGHGPHSAWTHLWLMCCLLPLSPTFSLSSKQQPLFDPINLRGVSSSHCLDNAWEV